MTLLMLTCNNHSFCTCACTHHTEWAREMKTHSDQLRDPWKYGTRVRLFWPAKNTLLFLSQNHRVHALLKRQEPKQVQGRLTEWSLQPHHSACYRYLVSASWKASQRPQASKKRVDLSVIYIILLKYRRIKLQNKYMGYEDASLQSGRSWKAGTDRRKTENPGGRPH